SKYATDLAAVGILALSLAAMVVRAAPEPALPAPDDVNQLRDRLARAELLGGLTPVEGLGVVVTLRNSPRPLPKGSDPSNLLIHDQDVNAVLNALRAAGAEAL